VRDGVVGDLIAGVEVRDEEDFGLSGVRVLIAGEFDAAVIAVHGGFAWSRGWLRGGSLGDGDGERE
jgi:hypothetical protein